MRSIVRWAAGAVSAAMLLAAQVGAADGVLIVQKVTNGSNPPQTHQIQIEQKRMRADVAGPTGATAAVMFDATRQVMTIVDDGRKSYTELSKADIDAFSSQISGAMAQMQEMMKTMSPEQKAMMEKAMKGRMGGAGATAATAAPKIQYKKTGTGTVGKWTCDKYDGYTNGQKTAEICTVDPKALGFTLADFQVTRDMAEFFKQFQQFGGAAMTAQQPFELGRIEDQGFSGIPVRSVVTSGGNQIVSELTEAKRQAFPDSTFQVPAGYKKNDMLGGRRGR